MSCQIMRRSSSFSSADDSNRQATTQSTQSNLPPTDNISTGIHDVPENRPVLRVTSEITVPLSQSQNRHNMEMARSAATQCWVCYGSVGEDSTATWIRPCRCRGGLEWVHQSCLHRWIDEKQRGDATTRVACSVCNYEYIIIYPPAGYFLETLHNIDAFLTKSSSLVLGVLLVGGLYWSGATYGALTLMQVLGHREGMAAIERVDPLFLLIGLPFIPIGLVLSRYINWQQSVLRVWRQYNRFLPIVQYFVPKDIPEWRREFAMETASRSAPMDVLGGIPRNIVGGLALPTISTVMGKLLYSRVRSNFKRTVLGLLTYLVLKGCLSLYYAESKFIRNCRRQIKEYSEEGREERD